MKLSTVYDYLADRYGSRSASPDSIDIDDVDFHQLLAKDGKMAAIWCSADVKDIRPDLTAVRLMAAAPKLHRALAYLLEQTVEMDLKHGIALSEGEEDARTQAQAALADAGGADPETRKHFRVEVVVRTREVYRVAAATADEAEEDWWDGQLLDTDDSLENEILSVEEERP
jgi:hypothetical protein